MLLTAFALAAALPHTAAAAPTTTALVAVAPQHIRDGGMVGDLYRPARAGRAPAILLLGGSEGGLGNAAAVQAAALAAHGYMIFPAFIFRQPRPACRPEVH